MNSRTANLPAACANLRALKRGILRRIASVNAGPYPRLCIRFNSFWRSVFLGRVLLGVFAMLLRIGVPRLDDALDAAGDLEIGLLAFL